MENVENKKETKMDMKKMSLIAGIVAAVLLVILIVSIVISSMTGLNQTKKSLDVELGSTTELTLKAEDFFKVEKETAEKIKFDVSEVDLENIGEYKAYAIFEGKKYTIKVSVVDTTAPKVNFAHRYVFTNDAANADFTGMFESIRDVSECTIKLIRFERSGNLGLMDEKTLKSLTDKINTTAKDDELKNLGTADVPTEPGIYRGVVEIMDEHGNAAYEEVYVILDKTGAKIEDVADKTITVSSDNLSSEPTIVKSEYEITDNVDGKIAADDITCELELRDEAKHEWLVHVSYVDRAGNESKATFLIIVKEGATESTQTGNGGGSNNGGNSTSGNAGNGNVSSNGGTTNNAGNTSTDSGSSNKPSYSGKYNIELIPQEDGSFYVNTSGDEWKKTPEWEDEHHISPYEQAVIDAGYGNVVVFSDGEYAVLMKDSYHTINGKNGAEILYEYLENLNLEPSSVSGGFIDSRYDWYMFIAKGVHEIDNSGNEWTGDGEIEFID